MCECISDMNAKLAEHNTAVVVPLLGQARMMVETYQVETGRGKKKAAKLFANYCPMCGEQYSAGGPA